MIPILGNRPYEQPSVFTPANLLREARRQKTVPSGSVPEMCILDPDGDLFRHLRDSGAPRDPHWACYHTDLLGVDVGGTTDAPFRETEEAIAFARSENLFAVEMEAAARYALAHAKGYPIVCFARVTNQMGRIENDFEKGESQGNRAFMDLIARVVDVWRGRR